MNCAGVSATAVPAPRAHARAPAIVALARTRAQSRTERMLQLPSVMSSPSPSDELVVRGRRTPGNDSARSGPVQDYRALGPDRSTRPRRRGLIANVSGYLFLPVEFLAPPPDLIGRQALDVGVVELPGRIFTPAQRRLHRGARGRSRLEQAQRELHRDGLRLRVPRASRRVPQREIAEQKARHPDK